MVLLTPSQVSVAISSVIVVLFTSALFLSGYVIQQRTLRDLRKAIRPDPRPSPKIYLPDRFKQSTTELPDGTVVDISDEDLSSGNPAQNKKGDFVIEIRPTIPEDDAQQQVITGIRQKQENPNSKEAKGNSLSREKQDKKGEEPVSRAERRRRIKEEIRELSQGESPMYYQRRLW
ncbi:hypothetical protein BKA67DRAFT_339895 [Truncatella angustata]|uniref:Uncharacterized protein n=1 Tax=Truncatella angustata TaxID=152316 RepID=A0A9P8UGZ7_9PEZI|nr:uncharacterized protein BKA67DRAFT_339895 [Truncatella angustata]KAH6651852.1 hypothetical protein BKA67DRAFT_339895 [Truncatella angustata]